MLKILNALNEIERHLGKAEERLNNTPTEKLEGFGYSVIYDINQAQKTCREVITTLALLKDDETKIQAIQEIVSVAQSISETQGRGGNISIERMKTYVRRLAKPCTVLGLNQTELTKLGNQIGLDYLRTRDLKTAVGAERDRVRFTQTEVQDEKAN